MSGQGGRSSPTGQGVHDLLPGKDTEGFSLFVPLGSNMTKEQIRAITDNGTVSLQGPPYPPLSTHEE